MLVVAQNAETKLLEELQHAWQKKSKERCLYLRLAEQNLEDDWCDLLGQTLLKIIDDPNLKIHVCHDNDVFILSKILTHKSQSQLLAHLAPKLLPASDQRLAFLFDAEIDHSRLRILAERKVQEKIIFDRKRQQEEAQQKKRDQALKVQAQEELLKSLHARRDKRDRPEILVVEDDEFSIKLVGNVLGKRFDVSKAKDGRQGVDSYIHRAPDVVFLDIDLPDTTGHNVLQKVFEIDPQAYVVMLSGNGNKANILKSLESGAKGFIGKPFTKEKLLQYAEKSPFVQQKRQAKDIQSHSVH